MCDSTRAESWLIDILVKSGRIHDPQLVAGITRLSGRLFSCRVTHIAIHLSNGETLRVVAKEPPQGVRMHGREALFYQSIAPRSPAPLLADCLHASFNQEMGHFLILLDDLSRDYCPVASDSAIIPSEEDAISMVRSLGTFHANWWEHPDLQSETFMGRQFDEKLLNEADLNKDATLAPYRPLVEQRLGKPAVATYLAIRDDYARKRCSRLTRKTDITLIHGDAHGGNFLKALDTQSLPVIIDWPNWTTGLATDDLVILASGWPSEYQTVRFEHLATIAKTNLPLSERTFRNDVRLSAERAFMLAVWNLAAETPPDWAWKLAERTHGFLLEFTRDGEADVAS